jgi:hypothetical protein
MKAWARGDKLSEGLGIPGLAPFHGADNSEQEQEQATFSLRPAAGRRRVRGRKEATRRYKRFNVPPLTPEYFQLRSLQLSRPYFCLGG